MRTSKSARCCALAIACLGLVVGGCISDDVTPQNISVAGKWAITCQPVNDDCPDFSITFDAQGDIVGSDLDGHKGAERGTGSIVDSTLTFRAGYGVAYEFTGALNGSGRSAIGKVTNFDYDGHQKTTPATATRQ